MNKNNCSMCEVIGDETFCGYYDVGLVLCDNMDCPEEEDDDSREDYYPDEDYTEY